MAEGPVAGRITVAPFTLPRFVAFATFVRVVPDETTAGAAGPPWRIGGDTAPGVRNAGNTDGSAPAKFFGKMTVWPIALRKVGAVIVGALAWLRDKIPGLAVFTLGLMLRICCCVTPRGGSTGGATGASELIGASAFLGVGLAPLASFLPVPFPLPPPLAALARAPWCAWPSLAKHGFTASAASTMLEKTSRKHISFVNADLRAGLRRRRIRCARPLAIQEQRLQRRHNHEQNDWPDEHAADHHGCERPLHLTADAGRDRRRQQADAGR